jgi:hypothetical protein
MHFGPFDTQFGLCVILGCNDIIENFRGLSNMVTLQLLSLRSCSASLQSLDNVATLLCLRSLDIGHCSMVHSLDPIRGFSRLEELALDFCGIDDSCVHDAISSLGSLPSLKLLNVAGTALALDDTAVGGSSDELLFAALNDNICIEPKSRRYAQP